MEAYYQQDMYIPISLCDREGKLSLAGTFALFMDLAAVHAELLGLGARDMQARGLFWLTVKTKIRFLRRPRLMEKVTASTRPIAPEKVRSIREYRLEQAGALLIEGKTEWAVIDAATGRLRPMTDLFSSDLELAKTPSYPAPFARVNPDFSGERELGSFRVRSVDIDIGRHMNNAAYLQEIFGTMRSEELAGLPQGEIEIVFRTPCFEGEILRVLRRDTEDGCELAALKQDGTPAVLIRAVR